ncbi:type I-MYXAN CRISPR-associated protein Cas5/Cmx5/DevS [Baaleninema simplex]|uniref:type I-MYXAN CRISPR-associated protein Cas5/Cmx5/DevS n=1 Tax=Baaleninema simplex TaxID=2862350 RepID=UPI00034BAC2E|nr:type I-MYXAN CRISPR-associated protein Cas5/Cmx5/DevS [Baaleninema simplex]
MENCLYLDCPCTSFPRSFARDYKETYRYPPPSTVYGLLLSLVGEQDLNAHLGVKLAIGVLGDDVPISRILRKQRHHKFSKQHHGVYSTAKFSKPNFQEILTDMQLAIRISSEEESAPVTLSDRVATALSTPETIARFGGLSLGESWAMVNGIRYFREVREADREKYASVRWLVKDDRGLIGLPVWIDRKTTRGTFQRFSVREAGAEFVDRSWVSIQGNAASSQSSKKRRSRRR